MKYSIYNTIVKLNDRYILIYNAFSDKFTVIKYHSNKLIKDFDPLLLKQKYLEIYRQLIKAEAIIKDKDDQTQKILDIYSKIVHNNELYSLTINPTLDCNFQCWYCYEEHIKHSKMSPKITQLAKEHIERVILNNKETIKNFALSFFGGEPLMRYRLVVEPILEYFNSICKDNNIKTNISFTSNGYLLNDKMIASLKQNSVNSFQITLDGSREQHNKTRFVKNTQIGSYDRIIANVQKLLDNQISVVLRINFTADTISGLKDIADDLAIFSDESKKYMNIDFQRVWQDGKSDITEIINEVIAHFSDQGLSTSYSVQELNGLKSPCYADYKNQVLINYNGDVFKCTARDFKPEKRAGYITTGGEIVWENNHVEKRLDLGLMKEMCKKCQIFPLCGGGCSQQLLETAGQDICSMGFDEEKIEQIVNKRFTKRFIDDFNEESPTT